MPEFEVNEASVDPLSPAGIALFDLLPTGVCIVAPDGRFLGVNDRYCRQVGYSREELLGMRVPDVVHPDDVDLDDMRAELFNGRRGDYKLERRYVRRTGETVWMRIHVHPGARLPDGSPCAIETTSIIEDLKHTQRELVSTQAHVAAVFDQSAAGVAETDSTGRYVAVNNRYCELLKRSREELLGMRMQDLTHPDDLQRNLPLFERVVHGGDPFELEKRYVLPDGSCIWADVAVSPVRPRYPGAPASTIAVLFDITARKKMEDELREAGRKKDEFLAMLAHELRNPMAPIAAAASLLRTGRLDVAKIGHVSEIITRQVRHMTGLVDDLLDVSRVTRGVAVLEQVEVDLHHVVEEAVEQVRPYVESRSHRLELDVTERAALVRGDPKRLVQVVANILDNATKYTPNGGTIRLALRTEGREAVLSISDTGIGMSPEVMEHAFELFTQAKRPVDRSQGGLGIGLALVSKLVELHHGSIRANSAGEDEGSEFTVTLPLAMQAHDADPAQMPARAEQRPLRTLVVDDNVDAAEMLGMLLETLGHEVRVEHRPSAALAAVRELAPDACILDIGLPEMDGNQLARRIRELPGMSDAMLVAVTGYGQDHDKRAAAEAGFDHHFVKPVAVEQLAAVLSTVRRNTQVELNLH